MLISIGYMCLMLRAPLDWQYAYLTSSASGAVMCYVLVRKMWDTLTNSKQNKKLRKVKNSFEQNKNIVKIILCLREILFPPVKMNCVKIIFSY